MKENTSLGVDVEQWRAEVTELSHGDPGYTCTELAEEVGISRQRMMSYINKLIKVGKCKVGKATRINKLGKLQHVIVYQLTTNKTIASSIREG